jgi:hypothetical protein
LLRLVTSTTHGRRGLPPTLIQLGIWRKSACHTSYSCGRCLFSHFLMKPSGPLGCGAASFFLAGAFSRSQATAPGVDFQAARKLPM